LRPGAVLSPTAGRRRAPAVGAVLLAALLSGCAVVASPEAKSWSPGSEPVTSEAAPTTVPSARVGKPGRTERVTFVPDHLVLAGDARAKVRPAETVDGQLKVPEEVDHVGWWDGSAHAGDPFGSTVIAGHLDSATDGIGFFIRLRRVKVGDVVTLEAGSRRLSYRIIKVETVDRQALATDSRAFDQTGDHRLVLITCTGEYRRDRGGYESNLVVTGRPLGLAR
jgi:LPXTG-site transpeptidase (sortase) family protein